ncbi:UNVERIFIED_CONTAM: hypothetical protein Slati_4481400 [Sesamum latifolium]|uniref:Retrotransposon gag domain-containing protein n=1 Tax=Sesamum latifolium TaxID=2727402 RepID=A0AAW2SSN2_9LAMI
MHPITLSLRSKGTGTGGSIVGSSRGGALEDESQGVSFTEAVLADELPKNCHIPAIAEYDGTTDLQEHLSNFEDAALLHRYINGNKCHVFVTTFARAAQQWFNQLPVGAIGSFQEFWSLFLHQFASNRKLRKTKFSRFAIQQKDNEPLKECLQRFNTSGVGVPGQEARLQICRPPSSCCKRHQYEDAQAAKKDSRREKMKEMKEEAPFKKPRTKFRDKKPPLPKSKYSVYPVDGTHYPSFHGDRRKMVVSSTKIMERRAQMP